MSIKQVGLIVVLVLLLTLAAGCAEDSAGPGAEIIGEEERTIIITGRRFYRLVVSEARYLVRRN